MNKKILAVILIALIVLAAGIYFVSKDRQASSGSNAINAPGGSKYGGLSSDLVPSAQQTDTVPSGEANIPP